MRDGSLGLGATRSETITQVILPAALPGIVGALLLTASRAIGETMIVVLAAGVAANLTLNPFEPMTTITVKIVNQLTGDLEFNSPQTLVAFALGITLFVLTPDHEHLCALHRAQVPGAVRMTDVVIGSAVAPPRSRSRVATSASSAAMPPSAASASMGFWRSCIGLLFLAVMLVSIVSKGYTAFFQTMITLPISFDEKIIDPGQQARHGSQGAGHGQLSEPGRGCPDRQARHRSGRQGDGAQAEGLPVRRRPGAVARHRRRRSIA